MNSYLSAKHYRWIHLHADLQGLRLWVISTGGLLTMFLVVFTTKLLAYIACSTTLSNNSLKR